MKWICLGLFAAVLCFSPSVEGQDFALRQSKQVQDLPSWGRAVDPDSNCKFSVTDGSLTIDVPGSDTCHDLAADIGVTNAPRVVQSVTGDFTLQVRIDGRFEPGTESTQPDRLAYYGAGIIAMDDENNVVTLARAVFQAPNEEPSLYVNFEIRVNGQLRRFGTTSDHPLPKDGPVFLRLERRGAKLIGAVSTDGANWDVLGAKEVPETWSKDLSAGLVAISTSKVEFNPSFSKFQVLK